MVAIEDFCIDLHEAPNQGAALPLVMYTFGEAAAWCQQRSRRLCFDDEWTRACAGAGGLAYPYGDTHVPGTCNDEESWMTYNQTLLNGWPGDVSGPDVMSLQELLDAARASSSAGEAAADHVESLYQGEASGANVGCVSADGVLDLCGNIEEWTRRRDGGTPGFSGNLKGRYWAESRTCQQTLLSHGDQYRFYELGFRCCSNPVAILIFSDGFELGSTSAWSDTVP
jgi:formylglycine-generating enzyme required for sulfatase activity